MDQTVTSPLRAEKFARLQQRIARLEGRGSRPGSQRRKKPAAFRVPAIDELLGGGLERGTLHEICSGRNGNPGALTGFVLGLVARSMNNGHVLWIQDRLSLAENGRLYGPGLEFFGLNPGRLLLLASQRPADTLWALEEGLKCSAIDAVIGEFFQDKAINLNTTRRLSLAAGEQNGMGFLLRHRPGAQPTAARTRWYVTAAPETGASPYGGLGETSFSVTLGRNRTGGNGHWTLGWDMETHGFTETIPRDLDATPAHGPAYAGHAA